MSDGGETEIVFTGAFGETEKKVGRIVVFHELPSFVDDEETAFLLGAYNVPNMREDDIHSNWSKFVFEVANIEHDHWIVDVDIGLLGENPSKRTSCVFAEALGKLWACATHV